MKKIIAISVAVLLAASTIQAQSWPKTQKFNPAIANSYWGKWINKDGVNMKLDKLSPVAISDVIDEVKQLLPLIDCDYDKPIVDKSIFYQDETEKDVSTFYINASIKFSRVLKGWRGMYNGRLYQIALTIDDNGTGITYGQAD